LIESNVEGTTYQVSGLENGVEYCFYVTQVLEGGVESCQSNVLCATPYQTCEDATAFAGEDLTICESDILQMTGQAGNYASVMWTTGGDGYFDDASNLYSVYTPGILDKETGYVELCLTAFAYEPCLDAMDCMIVTFGPLPTSDAGSDKDICAGDAYTLSGSATNYASVLWTSSGDGYFDDATLPGATYTPGANDIAGGTVELCMEAYGIGPCSDIAADCMILTIIPAPNLISATAGNQVVDLLWEPAMGSKVVVATGVLMEATRPTSGQFI